MSSDEEIIVASDEEFEGLVRPVQAKINVTPSPNHQNFQSAPLKENFTLKSSNLNATKTNAFLSPVVKNTNSNKSSGSTKVSKISNSDEILSKICSLERRFDTLKNAVAKSHGELFKILNDIKEEIRVKKIADDELEESQTLIRLPMSNMSEFQGLEEALESLEERAFLVRK